LISLPIEIALFLAASYVVGGIPFGLYVGKRFFNVDIREHGSKNIGATNAYRVLGKKAGAAVWCLDVGKGLLPVLLAKQLFPHHDWAIIGAGFAAIMGHTYSPFLGFAGGKGVATSLGVGFGLSWKGCAAAMGVWTLLRFVTGYVSVASLLGTPVGCYLVWAENGKSLPYGVFCAFVAILVIVKHRSNIGRLLKGTEPKMSAQKKAE
jgi:glycerol-3-phosphate acyltransferase PlsY